MFPQRAKKNKSEEKLLDKKDLINFVREQFKELMKKNLKIPVKLYHL